MLKTGLTIVDKLQAMLPDLLFTESNVAYWSYRHKTVHYEPLQSHESLCVLLHETAHGALSHKDFSSDLELLRQEVEAWQYAKDELAPKLAVNISNDLIEDYLETYREWLHNRSRCPVCSQTGLQIEHAMYSCLNCGCNWTVNDARNRALRRRVAKRKNTPRQ